MVLLGNVEIKELVADTPNAEVIRVYSATNISLKYDWHLNHMDNEAAVDL